MPEKTNWTGSVWGTNRGSLIAEIIRDGHRVEGRILLFEPGFGQTYVKLTGEWNDTNKITGKLSQFTGKPFIGKHVGGVELLTDPDRLGSLAEADLVKLDALYRNNRGGSREQ